MGLFSHRDHRTYDGRAPSSSSTTLPVPQKLPAIEEGTTEPLLAPKKAGTPSISIAPPSRAFGASSNMRPRTRSKPVLAQGMTYGDLQQAMGSSFTSGVDAARFRLDAARMTKRVATGGQGYGVCFPLIETRGAFIQRWDVVTLSALLFTLTVTPYEVALLPTELNLLFVVNQGINLIFITDMIVTFNLPFRRTLASDYVRERWPIALNYLQSWFAIDLLSCLPFDLLLAFNVFGDPHDPDAEFNPSLLRVVRLVRLVRLLKLARILRASRIFSRWESSFSMPYTTRTLIMWTTIVLVMVHW